MCIKSKCAKVAESAEKKNKNQKIKVLSVLEFKSLEQKTKFVYTSSLGLLKVGKVSKMMDVSQARIVPQNKNVSKTNATMSQV